MPGSGRRQAVALLVDARRQAVALLAVRWRLSAGTEAPGGRTPISGHPRAIPRAGRKGPRFGVLRRRSHRSLTFRNVSVRLPSQQVRLAAAKGSGYIRIVRRRRQRPSPPERKALSRLTARKGASRVDQRSSVDPVRRVAQEGRRSAPCTRGLASNRGHKPVVRVPSPPHKSRFPLGRAAGRRERFESRPFRSAGK